MGKNIQKTIIGIISIGILGSGAFFLGKSMNKPKEQVKEVVVVKEKTEEEKKNTITEANKIIDESKVSLKDKCGEEFYNDMKIVYDISVEACNTKQSTSEKFKTCEKIWAKWKDKEMNETEKEIFGILWYNNNSGYYRFVPPVMPDNKEATKKATDAGLVALKKLEGTFK